MCESSTRPQRIPSTRRRSTLATTTVGNESISAPSTPSGAQQPQQTNIAQTAITTTSIPTAITTEAVTSFPEAIIHSQIQQQQILSGLPVARHSIAQGNIIFNFIIKKQLNFQQLSKFLLFMHNNKILFNQLISPIQVILLHQPQHILEAILYKELFR